MGELAAVLLGAAIGAPLRYLVEQFVDRRFDPPVSWGTWLINIVGSFLLACVTAAFMTDSLSLTWLLFVGSGVCGGLTTFSGFAWQTHQLAVAGRWRLSTLNVAVTLAGCVVAAGLGWSLVSNWLG